MPPRSTLPAASRSARARFVDRLGPIVAADGLPRIAGRLFALLLISPEPVSLGELAAQLGVSKASVSLDARLLERRGLLKRISRPGDRRDYYAVSEDLVARTLEHRLARWRLFHQALVETRPSLELRDARVAARLDALDAAYEFLAERIGEALHRWGARRAPQRDGACEAAR